MLFLFADGRSALSDGQVYGDLAEEIENRLNEREQTSYESDGMMVHIVRTELNGQPCFLYLTCSLEPWDIVNGSLLWMSLVTALFAALLAFLASGFVAMLITKPVTEVTERAKRLARGDYALDLKKRYFCSEISELSDALDYAREEISKADAMQRELIANVSHDFKTPLTMIKAYASMIREISGEDKEKRDAHAKIIIDEADRLSELVSDVLDLSKLRSDVGRQAPVTFNLSETVYRIAGRFDYLAETAGYRFEFDVEDELYAYGERSRIEQVIYNLLGNAVNYTGEDRLVRVRLHRTEGGALFEVEDTGEGIPQDELDTIWDRYYRSKETHKRPVQGTGLGLSIVKSILQAHRCPFGVRSEVGKGSCFWAEFPPPPEDRFGEEAAAARRREDEE